MAFGSTKNFYCCRSPFPVVVTILPLEVLRISTVVDIDSSMTLSIPLEVLRISTVVDLYISIQTRDLWKY